MVPLHGECMAVSSFLAEAGGGGGLYSCILPCQAPTGYVRLSPRQSRSPRLYTALCKSLKYPTCTAVVVVLVVLVVAVQNQTKRAASFCPLRTSFPARRGVWELCLLFLPRDCGGAEQSGQGKATHLLLMMQNIFQYLGEKACASL